MYESTVVVTYEGTADEKICDDHILPRKVVRMETTGDLSSPQFFRFFGDFLRAVGFSDGVVSYGAAAEAFSEDYGSDIHKKTAKQLDITLNEDLTATLEARIEEHFDAERVRDIENRANDWRRMYQNTKQSLEDRIERMAVEQDKAQSEILRLTMENNRLRKISPPQPNEESEDADDNHEE